MSGVRGGSHPRAHHGGMDMLHGPLLGKIVLFAIPLAITSIFQQLFNTVDSIIAGQLIGAEALAAIGGVTQVINLFVSFLLGLSIGTNVVVAAHIGRGEPERVRGAIHTTAVITLVATVILTAASLLLVDPILAAINIPAEVWGQAAEYLHVYFCGFFFYLVYNFGSAILRAKGDSARPLLALAVAALLNIVLTYGAVAWLDGGVFGIALATVVSNAAAAGLVAWFLVREEEAFRLTFKGFAVVRRDLSGILHVGLPAGIQGMIFALSNVVVQGAINGFGTSAIAGSAAAMTYECYAYFFVNAFTQAAVTFVGQNYAAGNQRRCDAVLKYCLASAAVSAFLFSLVTVTQNQTTLSWFTSDSDALHYGAIRMWIVALFNFMTSSYEVTAGAMRGMGWSMVPTGITILGVCVLRIAFVLAVYPFVGTFESLMLLYPASWVVTGVAMLVAFVVVRKRAYAKLASAGRIATAA